MNRNNMDALSVCGTFSRDARAWGFPKGTSALYGKGAFVWLNDNKPYLDWVCGLGSNILGYSNNAFDHYVMMNMRRGSGFSIGASLEIETAEKLVNVLGRRVNGWSPNSLMVRWGLSGTDATSMAIRLARAVTGKKHIYIIDGGYHGWADWSVSYTYPALGVIPEESGYIHSLPKDKDIRSYNVRDAAAIIVEQSVTDPNPAFYTNLRSLCDQNGVMLIMDEVVTGFRYAAGGACEKYGIQPDLCCYGKALGNGIPVSALVGHKDYMEWFRKTDPVFCSSTGWGNQVSMAAANAVLDTIDDKFIRRIESVGEQFIKGLGRAGLNVIGHPQRSLILFDSDIKKAFFINEMRNKGILVNRPNFINGAHTMEHVERTVEAAEHTMNLWLDMSDEERLRETDGKIPFTLFKNR